MTLFARYDTQAKAERARDEQLRHSRIHNWSVFRGEEGWELHLLYDAPVVAGFGVEHIDDQEARGAYGGS